MNNLKNHISYLKYLTENYNFHCGWMSDETLYLISGYIKYYKPSLVIHTGFLWGKSSAFVLDALQDEQIELNPENSRDQDFYNFCKEHSPQRTNYLLIAIDNNMFNLNIDLANKYLTDTCGHFLLYNMSSDQFFLENKDNINKNETIMGIVDGDHTKDGCWNDLINLKSLNTKIIIVDDTIWIPYLDKLCQRFADEYNYDYINHKLYSGLGILIRRKV